MSLADAQPLQTSSPEPLWQPSRSHLALNEMSAFRRRVNQRFKVKLKDYWELHQWSVDNPKDFWAFLLEDSNIRYEGELEPAYSDDAMPHTRWFENIRLNYAQGVLSPRGISPYEDAIIALTETGHKRVVSYGELRDAVAACAESLRKAGVEKGDRVVAYIGNVPEAVVILLACASMGAIFSSGSPDFGFETAKARFGQVEPKVLFASSCYFYNGKRYETLECVQQLAAAIPSIQQVVVVPYPEDNVVLAEHHLPENTALWDDFLTKGASIHYEMLPFDHPIYILFSSGTTGLPKAITHRTGGVFLTHYKEQRLHSNIQKGNRVFYFTTCGWMMWNWLVSALTQGCEIMLYEGSPAYPDITTLWKQIEELKLNFFGTSAGFIHACRNTNLAPKDICDLSSLETLASTGSPLSPEGFAWVYEAVKEDVHLASICGGTDIAGCFMLGVPSLPVYAGEIQAAGLGVDLAAFSEDGAAIAPETGEAGELVCRQPLPSMPLKFWNDEDGARYHNSYFADYPNVWRHGDRIAFSDHGGITVYGRSDATLNPGGVRIGTAEIYRPLESIPSIKEAIAVGKKVDADEVVWLFVSLQEGATLSDALKQNIKQTLRSQASPRHVPKEIIAVEDLPRTRSGKLSEIAVSRVVNGKSISNHSALANPEVLESIHASVHSLLEPTDTQDTGKNRDTDTSQAVEATHADTKQASSKVENPSSNTEGSEAAPNEATSNETKSTLKSLLGKSLRKRRGSDEGASEDSNALAADTSDTADTDDTADAVTDNRNEATPVVDKASITKKLLQASEARDSSGTLATESASSTKERVTTAKDVTKESAKEATSDAIKESTEDVAQATENQATVDISEAAAWKPHEGQAFAPEVLKRHLHALKEPHHAPEEHA